MTFTFTPPPYWKIKREVKRIGRNLSSFWTRLWDKSLATPYYDFFLAPRTRRTFGTGLRSGKVAIYLIFPTKGLLDSHREALRYLAANGYECLVVSNLALRPKDRADVAKLSARILERPNYGYDFGGYRDGVLALADRLPHLARLVLLNDSAWFPMPGSRNWLAAAEALNLDFVGAATSFAVPRVDFRRLDQVAWTFDTSDKHFHYTSFGLMMSKGLLTHPEFKDFWRRFPLTNDKRQTVLNGEIGLTKWVQARGLTHGATEDLSQLGEELARLPDAEIFRIFREIVMPDSHGLEAEWRRLRQRPTVTRAEATTFILAAAANQGPAYALAGHLMRSRGFAFLKKSPLWLSPVSSEVYRELIEGMTGDFGGVIREEAKVMVARLTRQQETA